MKRLFDLFVALVLLIIIFPIMIVISLFIRVRIGSPVLFKQQRPGLYGKPFYIVKFRTMTNKTDETGRLLPDELRITPFGTFLRKYSLDELPQLFNVLKGDLSLVGPRPLLMSYLPLYTPEQAKRHNVRPGITGWAQVNGRNAITWEEKFKLDVWYVNHQSIWLDLKILFLTIKKVMKREGISFQGYVSSPVFTGSSIESHQHSLEEKS